VLGFAGPAELDAWLASAHATSAGIWLRCAKKGCPELSVTYAEAVEVVLCWGWIDGQKAAGDGDHFLQRLTPRRPRSRWSAVNVATVGRLTAAGRMRPPGLAAVAAAQADGRWDAAYAGARTATVPPELAEALASVPAAEAAFAALSGTNRYAVIYRISTLVTPQARVHKAAETAARLAQGWVPHPPS